MSRPYQEVDKPFSVRILELVRSLQLIADAIRYVQEGKSHYLIPLSGQLRALLTERSRSTDPLLLYVAGKLQQELHVYCTPDVNDPHFPQILREDVELVACGVLVTLEQQELTQVRMTFSEVLDRELIIFRGSRYTARTIIEWYANKAGGAHYASRLPEDFADLLSMNLREVRPLANILLQLGQATITAGRKLLKSLIDLELHALIVVPPQDVQPLEGTHYLFDANYQGTAMRFSLVLDTNLIPSFFVYGLQGVGAIVRSDRIVDWSKPRYVHASVTIEEDLSTRLQLVIDGVRVGQYLVGEPLFVLSNIRDYDLFHNRAFNSDSQQLSFGFAAFVVVSADLSPMVRAATLQYMLNAQSQGDSTFIFYKPGAFASAPKGSTDLEMTGDVLQLKADDILVVSAGINDLNPEGSAEK